jgi:hypothetical protein
MAIFDALTGEPGRQAANDARGHFAQVGKQGALDINQALVDAVNRLHEGRDNSKIALNQGYGTARGDIQSGAKAGMGFIDEGVSGAQGALAGSRTALGQAVDAYKPLSDLGAKYGRATTLGMNALGVGGVDAANAARAAFTASPAYDFNMSQGLEAINRRRAAGGMLDSGNADRDAQTFGAGLASNEYNSWLNNLLGFTNPELAATSGAATGRAGAFKNLSDLGVTEADLLNKGGLARAGLATDEGRSLAALAAAEGTGLGNLEWQAGQRLADTYTDASRARTNLNMNLASPYANTYKQGADAVTAASGNAINLAQNAIKAVAGGGFGMPGGGGAGASFAGVTPAQSNFWASGNIGPV